MKCAFDGCGSASVYAKGMCSAHYKRQWKRLKYGQPGPWRAAFPCDWCGGVFERRPSSVCSRGTLGCFCSHACYSASRMLPVALKLSRKAAWNAAWRSNNPQKTRAYWRKWYAKNREHNIRRARDYMRRNPDKRRKWQQNNKSRRNYGAAWAAHRTFLELKKAIEEATK